MLLHIDFIRLQQQWLPIKIFRTKCLDLYHCRGVCLILRAAAYTFFHHKSDNTAIKDMWGSNNRLWAFSRISTVLYFRPELYTLSALKMHPRIPKLQFDRKVANGDPL